MPQRNKLHNPRGRQDNQDCVLFDLTFSRFVYIETNLRVMANNIALRALFTKNYNRTFVAFVTNSKSCKILSTHSGMS